MKSDVGPKLNEIGCIPEVKKIFEAPNTTGDYSLEWGSPDPEQISKILCDESEFSENRIGGTIKKLEDAAKASQSKLDSFF